MEFIRQQLFRSNKTAGQVAGPVQAGPDGRAALQQAPLGSTKPRTVRFEQPSDATGARPSGPMHRTRQPTPPATGCALEAHCKQRLRDDSALLQGLIFAGFKDTDVLAKHLVSLQAQLRTGIVLTIPPGHAQYRLARELAKHDILAHEPDAGYRAGPKYSSFYPGPGHPACGPAQPCDHFGA